MFIFFFFFSRYRTRQPTNKNCKEKEKLNALDLEVGTPLQESGNGKGTGEKNNSSKITNGSSGLLIVPNLEADDITADQMSHEDDGEGNTGPADYPFKQSTGLQPDCLKMVGTDCKEFQENMTLPLPRPALPIQATNLDLTLSVVECSKTKEHLSKDLLVNSNERNIFKHALSDNSVSLTEQNCSYIDISQKKRIKDKLAKFQESQLQEDKAPVSHTVDCIKHTGITFSPIPVCASAANSIFNCSSSEYYKTSVVDSNISHKVVSVNIKEQEEVKNILNWFALGQKSMSENGNIVINSSKLKWLPSFSKGGMKEISLKSRQSQASDEYKHASQDLEETEHQDHEKSMSQMFPIKNWSLQSVSSPPWFKCKPKLPGSPVLRNIEEKSNIGESLDISHSKEGQNYIYSSENENSISVGAGKNKPAYLREIVRVKKQLYRLSKPQNTKVLDKNTCTELNYYQAVHQKHRKDPFHEYAPSFLSRVSKCISVECMKATGAINDIKSKYLWWIKGERNIRNRFNSSHFGEMLPFRHQNITTDGRSKHQNSDSSTIAECPSFYRIKNNLSCLWKIPKSKVHNKMNIQDRFSMDKSTLWH